MVAVVIRGDRGHGVKIQVMVEDFANGTTAADKITYQIAVRRITKKKKKKKLRL